MNKAKVLWFNEHKGYGFCIEESTGEEIFIHYSAITSNQEFKTLQAGQEIFIETCVRHNKLCANRIFLPPLPKNKSKTTQKQIQLSFDLN